MVSKKWLSALAAIAICTGACATGTDPAGSPEQTSNSTSAQVVAPLACTPLLTTPTMPFLSCFGDGTAATIQASILSQMQLAFANVSLQTDLVNQQVIITSQAAEFAALFGTQIVVPLLPAGIFTAAIPVTLGTLAPNLALTANIFGIVPGVFTPFATGAPLATLNTAAVNAAASTSIAASSASLAAATMPLTFFLTSPAPIATVPLACNGAFMLGCL